MSCPNCGTPFSLVNLDSQSILHCANCGASFFEENGINRITIATAEKLQEDKKSDDIAANAKICPKDASPLSPLQHDEAIPQNVTLLRCSKCHGIFVYADDLVDFKKAQTIKTEYYKTWSLPLPSLRAVLVISLAVFAFVSLLAAFNRFITPGRQIQAEDLIKKTSVSRSGRFVLISFSTTSDFKSDIVYRNLTTGDEIRKKVSRETKTVHFILTDDIPPTNIEYQIILINSKGKEIKSKWTKL